MEEYENLRNVITEVEANGENNDVEFNITVISCRDSVVVRIH